MMARFVGGPEDGLVMEIADGISEVRMAVKTEEISYWRTRWTRDGCRLFVVEGYDRSLIGDEEIDAAARWLAEEMDAHGTRSQGQDGYRGLLAVARDRACVDQPIGAQVSPRPWIRSRVHVAPGLALGYRELGYRDDETEPCWRWPQVVTAPSGRYR